MFRPKNGISSVCQQQLPYQEVGVCDPKSVQVWSWMVTMYESRAGHHLHHCKMMKLIWEYNAYIDARVARLAEVAVDEKSIGGGDEEEEDEERPFVVFKPPAKKGWRPTATAKTKRITKKAPLKQIESVASSSTATNVSQETQEVALDSDE